LQVVVFLSTCDSVDFHHTVLSQLEWSRGLALDAENKQKFLSCKVFRLHGSMDQEDRKKSYLGFSTEKSAILVCTDVAARGLDIPKVKCIIQYDSPGEASEYVHRYLKYLMSCIFMCRLWSISFPAKCHQIRCSYGN
jgi:ATP-dependent RNA helicase DDX31/DBP7